jgi:hypothetical protein
MRKFISKYRGWLVGVLVIGLVVWVVNGSQSFQECIPKESCELIFP